MSWTITILEPRTAAEQRTQDAVNTAEGIALRLDLMRGYLNREKYGLARATLADVRRMLPSLNESELLKSDRGADLARKILRLPHLARRLEVEPAMSLEW